MTATTSATAAPASHRWRGVLPAAAIVAMTFIAYAPALSAGYVWDDDYYLTKNPLITAPDGLHRIWLSPRDSPSQYFPLVYTSFRIEHALWGMNPRGYHAVNIALHAINALLIWLILRKLNVPGAYFAACVFALHPVHVESVAWITERKNVLSGVFYWLSLLAWMGFAGLPSGPGGTGEASALRKKTFWYVAAFMSFVLAMFAKTTACTLPAAMVLVLWVRREKLDWRRWLQIAPFVLWGLAMGLVSILIEQTKQGTAEAVGHFPWIDRLLVASRAIWFYALKLIWPIDLAFSYPKWKIDPTQALQYLPLVACTLLAAGLWAGRKRYRWIVAGIVYFIAAHLPTLGFIPLLTFLYTFVADHYQYLPSIGLIVVAAAGIWRLPREAALAVSVIVLMALATLTWRQSHVYANAETLWRDTLEKNPSSWMAHTNLAAALLERDDRAGARRELEIALSLRPENAEALLTLGRLDELEGNNDAAIERYRQAIAARPAYPDPHYNLGQLYARLGRRDLAFDEYLTTLKMNPRHALAHNNVGVLLMEAGKPHQAIEHYRAVLRYDPGNLSARSNLATALLATGEADEAMDQWRQVLRADPDNAVVRNNLGIQLAQRGRLEEAQQQFRRAIASRPDMSEAHTNLGVVLEKLGQPREAMREYERALVLRPDDDRARSNLQRLRGKAGS